MPAALSTTGIERWRNPLNVASRGHSAASMDWGIGLTLAGVAMGLIGVGMTLDYRGMTSRAQEAIISSRRTLGLSPEKEMKLRSGRYKTFLSMPYFLGAFVMISLGIWQFASI